MDALSGSINGIQSLQRTSNFARFTRTEQRGSSIIRDTVEFGSTTLTLNQSTEIVLEKVFEKLRAVVDDARAELGLGPGQETDLSAEATAGRIVHFALGAFGTF